tara:strand:+ start:24331 stop:24480 length:150 start_codon:yes stop_codon:yes gene_type:complete
MQFLGFLIFMVIATGAFFTIFALSIGLPTAFIPKKEEEEESAEETSTLE